MTDFLEDFYRGILDGKSIQNVHIPRSDVIYIRSAVKAKYDYDATVQEIEEAILELYDSGEITAPESLIRELRRDRQNAS